MLRSIKIGAIVVLVNLVGPRSAGAETMTWGVFRENATNVSESQRNCWSQAMVSGLTINGEIMAQNLSQEKSEAELQRLAKRGLCAAERTSASWSARGQGRNVFGQYDASGSGSDWSHSGRFDGDWDHDVSMGNR